MAEWSDAGCEHAPAGECESPGPGITLGEDRAILERASRSDCTLLITGETGVGKGYVAEWLHRRSPRAERPFVPVNCGAIPESLIDSQLFGHVRGAFSGATADHIGLIRAADGGTLFLDEISELPATAQTRLLRLLQEREVQPVGHPRPLIVDVRVMAASNADLDARVADLRFRDDLLYRIDVIRICLRPLRERVGEIPHLVDLFNREFAQRYDRSELRFTRRAREVLRAYAWPGNIRQLRTVLERLHVLCPTAEVDGETLIRLGRLEGYPDRRPPRPIEQVRFDEVRRVLATKDGSITRTAEVFGVHRSTIYRWLNRRG